MRKRYREIYLKREVSTAKKVMLVFTAFSLVMLFTIFLLFNKSHVIELTGNIIQILSGENQTQTATITANFSDEIGRVREDFYGVDNNGKWFG